LQKLPLPGIFTFEDPMGEEYSIRLNIEKVENGQFLATSDNLPGLVAQGRTIAETVEIAQDVARKLLDSYLEHGDPIPQTLTKIQNKIKLDVTIGI
jgi:predicted RNase H-like HicB family nuclease